MYNLEIVERTEEAPRHYSRVMAFAVLGIFFLGIGCILYYGIEQEGLLESIHSVNETPPQAEVSKFARSQPTQLRIPSLDLRTTFVAPLTLNTDKTISVPDSYTQVGWYINGATPGENGSAVILGHVDSKDGPAIFYSLGQLHKDDEISIERQDGTTAVFLVDKLERYPQDTFPTEEVYGKTNSPTLKLVTCSGTFNKGKQTYSHNLVVYAHLKE